MADQISDNMGNLSLGSGQPTTRSYIPPHMRNKMTAANGPAPNMNGPGGPPSGPPGPPGPPAPMGGLNNSAWAG